MKTRVIQENLERLTGFNEGDLGHLQLKESMGGTAATWKELSCIGANFYFDRKTGTIIYFENCQSVPENIRSRYQYGFLRIAIDIKKGIEQIVDLRTKELTLEAQENLGKAFAEYNKIRAAERSIAAEEA